LKEADTLKLNFRLLLASWIKRTIATSLDLLGVEAPEVM
jgi:arginyl-tRNA synthetase